MEEIADKRVTSPTLTSGARILTAVTRSALRVLVAEFPFSLKPIAEVVARHRSPSQIDFVGAGRNLMVTHAVKRGLGRVWSRRPGTLPGVPLRHHVPLVWSDCPEVKV